MTDKQSLGRAENSALPPMRPDASTSDEAVKRVGKDSSRKAGPDGPDATEIGYTFKRAP